MRVSEDEYKELLSRRNKPTPEHVQPRRTPRARVASKLELELAGHLSVMELKPEQQFKFHPERKWRLDFAFPDVHVGVEIDGGIFAAENGGEAGKHARGAGRCADMEKRNAAGELGWVILNYGPPHIRSGEAALQIERVVTARRAVAVTPFALCREIDGSPLEQRLEHQHPRKRKPNRRGHGHAAAQ